jgi:serine protease Do
MMRPMAPAKKTLYQILGVGRDASEEDIGLAHEMRMSDLENRTPPDPSTLALVQQAFEILSDPKRRAAYDSRLLSASEKAAAEQQGGTPDLEIGEDEEPKKKLPVVPIAAVAVVAIVALFFALRSPAPKPPAPVADAPTPAAPPPPPPKMRNAAEVLADATPSAGPLMVYSMSGVATQIGMALAIDQGTMVTTCHGIPAGGKMVVRVGKEQLPADLTITDEALDLCRLSVAGLTAPPLRLASDEATAGEKIVAISLDAKGALVTAEGTIKAMRKGKAGNLLELSTPIAANASGAGIFDQYGKLVAIATVPHELGPGAHIAIPSTAIAQMRSRTR